MFVGRQEEIAQLDQLVQQGTARMLLGYGRRQVGKTTLALQWAETTGRDVIYWVATNDTPAQLRYSLGETIWQWAHPDSHSVPAFRDWDSLFGMLADLINDHPVVVILDQFSYAVECDPTLPGHLQTAWDSRLKERPIVLFLIGSNAAQMLALMSYAAPLYGRVAGEVAVDPLAFPFVQAFLPSYSIVDRLGAYAVTGGIPAYLLAFDTNKSLAANVQALFMQRRSPFRNEPVMLLAELLPRETRNYEAMLKAIAGGARTPQDICNVIGQPTSWISTYLRRLEEVGLVERVLPATTLLEERERTRTTLYFVLDRYLDWHFRFIAPHLRLVEQNLAGALWTRIAPSFETWVGETVFRALCREWVVTQARIGTLLILPEIVGRHWGGGVDMDVVGIAWGENGLVLGTCDWGTEPLLPAAAQNLADRAKQVAALVKGSVKEPTGQWQVLPVLFARAGFAEPTRETAEVLGIRLVDLVQLDADLQTAYLPPAEEEPR